MCFLSALSEEVIVDSPNVAMKITDRNGQDVMQTAEVGDPLALKFEIIDKNSPYEIFVRELVAMDGIDSSEIVLIDSDGCPTDHFIMGPLYKTAETGKVCWLQIVLLLVLEVQKSLLFVKEYFIIMKEIFDILENVDRDVDKGKIIREINIVLIVMLYLPKFKNLSKVKKKILYFIEGGLKIELSYISMTKNLEESTTYLYIRL